MKIICQEPFEQNNLPRKSVRWLSTISWCQRLI